MKTLILSILLLFCACKTVPKDTAQQPEIKPGVAANHHQAAGFIPGVYGRPDIYCFKARAISRSKIWVSWSVEGNSYVIAITSGKTCYYIQEPGNGLDLDHNQQEPISGELLIDAPIVQAYHKRRAIVGSGFQLVLMARNQWGITRAYVWVEVRR